MNLLQAAMPTAAVNRTRALLGEILGSGGCVAPVSRFENDQCIAIALWPFTCRAVWERLP
jgi:hypothetical protein